MPSCVPLLGSIDSLVRPSFSIDNSRPSQGAMPHEADDAKTPEGIALLGLAPEGQRVLCRVYLTRLS